MKCYQLTYLINPEVGEKQLQDVVSQINDFIRKEGGVIEKEDKPIKKRLGYLIEKRQVAFLVSLVFLFDSQKLSNLEILLKENSQIIRHLLLVKLPISQKPRRREKVAPLLVEKSKPEKVELKEIEKKLKEILGE
ncbi:MAG TPA: 30S ribosomal protein S6 [Candidatus Parcubacteria bacterium]|jgi:small subunit ribosomal protein S6|nr:30S ribosomal protein S6 [Candidatus Parcubacteria bacterium]|tara:strand:+ start:1737 stop:2141 length:405 start_codon:yes stop_codon:yes gene_type:complete